MKHVLIIGDGMADRPLSALGNRTPLAYLSLPGMARLASQRLALARTVPPGVPPGSDTAILSIFGCDPRESYTGRAALEAAGAGVFLAPEETAWRVNLCAAEGGGLEAAILRSHNGFGIQGPEALETVRVLEADPAYAALARRLGFILHKSPTFRQIGVGPSRGAWGPPLPGPHDHLGEAMGPLLPRGDIRLLVEASFAALYGRRANCVWPWAPGEAMRLPAFSARYGLAGSVVSAVPLVKGIASLMGLSVPDVPGATGELDTNYEGKADAVAQALAEGAGFAAVHVEAPDECAHALDLEGKLEALRRLDSRLILPLLDRLDALGGPFRVLFLADHPTYVENGLHSGSPVPFCLFDSRLRAPSRAFHEAGASAGGVLEGTALMGMLTGGE